MGMNLNYTLESPVMNELLAKIDNLTNAVNAQSVVTLATQRNAGPGELLTAKASIASPVRDIVIYGRSTQSGTPTASAPVAIDTAGSGGTLNVTGCGKNLIDISTAHSTSDAKPVVVSYPAANTITLSNSTAATYVGATIDMPMAMVNGQKYTMKATISQNSAEYCNICFRKHRGNTIVGGGTGITFSGNSATGTQSVTFTWSLDEPVYFCVLLTGGTSATNTVTISGLQLEAGETATGYTPFAGSAFPVTVPSTGLPGIPVTSGGNYIDASGQQWICDTVDLGKGVYTQRVGVAQLKTGDSFEYQTSGGGRIMFILGSDVYGDTSRHPVVSNCGSFYATSDTEGYAFVAVNSSKLRFYLVMPSSVTSQAAAETWLSSKGPVDIQYILPTPAQTALTAGQVAQLRAISMIDYETWMYNDGGSGMKARYNADIVALLAE